MPHVSLVSMQISKEGFLNSEGEQDYNTRLKGVNFHPQLLPKVEVENALNYHDVAFRSYMFTVSTTWKPSPWADFLWSNLCTVRMEILEISLSLIISSKSAILRNRSWSVDSIFWGFVFKYEIRSFIHCSSICELLTPLRFYLSFIYLNTWWLYAWSI